jgi:hypothetical protein
MGKTRRDRGRSTETEHLTRICTIALAIAANAAVPRANRRPLRQARGGQEGGRGHPARGRANAGFRVVLAVRFPAKIIIRKPVHLGVWRDTLHIEWGLLAPGCEEASHGQS